MANPLNRSVLGLDLGSHSIKAVELRQTLRDVEVVQLRSVLCEPEKASPADLLPPLIKTHALPTGHVVCALPGQRLSSRRLSFPFSDRRKLDQAVPFAVEDEVPFEFDEMIVDWEPVGGDRSHTDVSAIIAPRADLARLLGSLREAGVEPRTVEAEGLMLANLSALFYLPGTRLLLDLGHRKSTLCLTRDGKPLAARTIPIAGHALSAALARDYGIALTDAEQLKCEEGIFRSGFDSDSPAAVAVLDRLARELARTLGSFEAVLGGSAPSQLDEVTLLGGTARLHRLDDFFAERLGIPTARLSFPQGPKGAALVAGGDPLLFGTATALALRGTAGARTRTNLRQDEFAMRVDYRTMGREMRWTAVLGGLVLLLAAATAGVSLYQGSRRTAALEAEMTRLYSEAFPNQPVPQAIPESLRASVRSAHERAEFLGIYRGNLSALTLLAEISARVPGDLEVVFDEVTIDGRVARIRGFTKSFEAVDRLRQQLSAFPLFGNIQVSEIQNESKRGGKSFTMTLALGGSGGST